MPCTALGCALWQAGRPAGCAGLAAGAGACACATPRNAASATERQRSSVVRFMVVLLRDVRNDPLPRPAACTIWLTWPALTITQRSVKPPTSTSSAGTTVCGMRCAELEPLQHERHQDAERDDRRPRTRSAYGPADDQRGGGRVRGGRRLQVDEQQADQHELDREEGEVGADQRVDGAAARAALRPAAGPAPRGRRRSCPAAPGGRGSSDAARCIIAAPADSPENRNSGPRIALFHSGRATIVLSRMPV